MITVPDHAEEIKVRLPALLKSQAQIEAVCADVSLNTVGRGADPRGSRAEGAEGMSTLILISQVYLGVVLVFWIALTAVVCSKSRA